MGYSSGNSTNSNLAMSLAVLLLASMACGCMASRDSRFRFNHTDWHLKHRGWWSYHYHPNATQATVISNKIVVGDSEHWRFNFTYTDWVFKHGPFYVNDILVFKYDPPSDNNPHPHSVYLLSDLKSFVNCDLSNAKQIANTTQGAGEGFEFVLDKWQPYYFACGASNGYHCNVGHMKFFVMPMFRAW